jgi:transcriptional regulator EpsA
MAPQQDGEPGLQPSLPQRRGYLGMESHSLSDAQAQALLRLVETAPDIHRRSQFFTWMQSHLQVLVPHVLAVCGAYDRRLQRIGFDVFNSSVLPRALVLGLSGSESALMHAVLRAWIEGQGRPFAVDIGPRANAVLGADCAELGHAGLTRIAAHGVARPGRAHEVETFFLFGEPAPAGPDTAVLLHRLELLMPHLHSTYLRVQVLELELAAGDRAAPGKGVDRVQGLLSKREREIMQWVREGKTNQQIGDGLGISALTVKNHVQSILRKLGASNRAQAVATAMNAQLMGGDAPRGDGPPAFGSDSGRKP